MALFYEQNELMPLMPNAVLSSARCFKGLQSMTRTAFWFRWRVVGKIGTKVWKKYSDFFRSTLILSSPISLGFPSGLFHSGFPTNTHYAPLLFYKPATCLAHLTPLNLITRLIFGEEYKSCAVLSSPLIIPSA
jgi:hypothetical protein